MIFTILKTPALRDKGGGGVQNWTKKLQIRKHGAYKHFKLEHSLPST